MTYTELTETDAKPSAEEAAALRIIPVIIQNQYFFAQWDYLRESRQDEIFAEIVKAVKGEK